jgi:hypothetical protein
MSGSPMIPSAQLAAPYDAYFALIVVHGAAGSDELNVRMTSLALTQQSAVDVR